MSCRVLSEENLGHLEELGLKEIAVKVEGKHHMNTLCDQVSVLHLLFVAIKLDQLDYTVHQSLAHNFIHLGLHC